MLILRQGVALLMIAALTGCALVSPTDPYATDAARPAVAPTSTPVGTDRRAVRCRKRL